jgi:hypothetical protein
MITTRQGFTKGFTGSDQASETPDSKITAAISGLTQGQMTAKYAKHAVKGEDGSIYSLTNDDKIIRAVLDSTGKYVGQESVAIAEVPAGVVASLQEVLAAKNTKSMLAIGGVIATIGILWLISRKGKK